MNPWLGANCLKSVTRIARQHKSGSMQKSALMIREYLLDYRKGLEKALDNVSLERFEELVRLLESAYHEEHQVFLMGNGGSGSTASHIACDLNKGVSLGLQKRFRVICLNDNLPTLMAYANDVAYEEVFVEPLKNFLRAGDLVIALSGSGNSPNLLKAIAYANSRGAHTVGLSGFDGGKLAALAHTALVVPAYDMQKAEDVHFILFHVIMHILSARLRAPLEVTPQGTVSGA
jgi:D-sedoheptulose 7-phosphate isomerase